MLERIFPRTADNTYRGNWLAIWLLVPILIVKLAISGASMFNSVEAAGGADGIPLASFSPAAVDAVLSIFVLLAWAQLIPVLFGFIALLRYRGLTSLAYLLLLIEHGGRRVLNMLHASPAAATGGAGLPIGVTINLGLLAALIVGLALSLMGRRRAPASA